jgi:hypothetical protein
MPTSTSTSATLLHMTSRQLLCVKAILGVGEAPFIHYFRLPQRRCTWSETERRAFPVRKLTLSQSAPLNVDLIPLHSSFDGAKSYHYALNFAQSIAPTAERWRRHLHPAWIMTRMTKFLDQSCSHFPAIHTRTQAQFFDLDVHRWNAAGGGDTFSTYGSIERLYRSTAGHHYAVVDGLLQRDSTDGGDIVALMKHTTIFHIQPRSNL